MLDLLRKRAQSPLIQGTIMCIALVFIFWGVGGGYKGNRNSVAQVNDESIPYENFQKAYDRLANQYRDQFGGNLPKGLLENLDLQGQAIEQLIQRTLLRQGAQEMGIMVSDLEIQQAVEEMEAFRTNGVFDVEQYKNILSSSGMTPTAFEDSLRTDLLAGKVIEHLSRFAKLTPLEINEQLEFDNEQIKLEYVSFSADDFKEQIEADDEKVSSYYEENKENYMTEPLVQLSFLAFPFASEQQDIVSDEEAESYYRQNFKRYSIPEQRSARHILFKTTEQDSEDVLKEKREQASLVLELARSGEDFAELAKQYSEGPSAPRGGDLGTFSQGRMVKPFDDAVFALNEGDISEIVETQFGFHIIKLEKIQASHTRTLEEVKGEIAALLAEKKSRELAFSQATEAYEKIIMAGSLDRFSAENDIPMEKTEYFPRKSPEKSGATSKIASEAAFLNAAFSLNKGELSSLVETKLGYAIIFATDKQEPQVAPLEDVKDQVLQDFIEATAEAMALEAADTLLASLKEPSGPDISAAAALHGKSLKESDYITRSQTSGAALPDQIVEMAFELTEENPYPEETAQGNGMFYVFRVSERKTPDAGLLSKKVNDYKAGMLEMKKANILASWLANVRSRSEIVINEQFL